MRAGRLRHRVSLQAPNEAQSGTDGSVTPTWATENTFWANQLPQAAREFVLAQQRDGELTTVFACRYREDVTNKKRLLWDSRVFDIRGFWNPDGRKRELLISCREVQ
jgi:SPP1 family predicted phage head-tail adaptor